MRFPRHVACFLICFAICSSCRTAGSAEETPFEFERYRVRVAVAFSHDHHLTAKYRRQVLGNLTSAIERSTAGQWILDARETLEIAPANRLGLERFSAEDFRPKNPAEEEPPLPVKYDKQFLLTVDVAGSKFQLAGREWDELTLELSPVEEAETYNPRAVADELCGLVSELFHPLLSVEEADVARNAVSLKLKAGGYVPSEIAQDQGAEPLRAQLRQGTLLIAFFRYHNQDGSVREVQFLPWTYLVVDDVVRGRVAATLVTGIRTPLGAKTSKRVQSLAVVRKVRHPSTTIEIQLRKNPRKKLAGHYISATAEKYPDEKNQSPELFKRITDRLGRLEIPVVPEHDILWLRVHSGNMLLALVPFAPGLVPEIVLDLPDDSIRLAVEGDLTQIRAQLIDTVARRAALMVRARKAVEQKDWKKVDEEMAKLDDLPSLKHFQEEIGKIRTYATNDENRSISPLIKRRVQTMCQAADDLVKKYLSEERINQLKEEIRERRNN